MDPLVSVEWLAEHLQDPQLVVLDATLTPPGVTLTPDVHTRYREGHIPGALFFDIEALSDHSTSLPHMLPSPDDFARAMSALGVSDAITFVLYEQQGLFSAPRAWWMLRTMGVHNVLLLDGGLPAWVKAGQPVNGDEVTRPPAHFAARFDARAVLDLQGLRETLVHKGQVVDARSSGRFAGTAPEPRPGLRSGHMPGALSVPYTELATADGHLKGVEDLHVLFKQKGVDLQQPVTVTCGSGVSAAVLALGLERIGANDVRLYDGSWAEYAQQPDAVILSDQGRPD